MRDRTHIIYLLLGSLLYWLATAGFMWDKVTGFSGGELILSLLIITSSIAHLWFFNKHSKFDTSFEAEQIFTKVLTAGIVTFAFAIIPFILSKMEVRIEDSEVLIRRFLAYIYLLFFLYTFTMYRKLMHMRKTTAVIRQWDSLLVVLVLSTLCNLKGVAFTETFPILLYIMGGAMLIPLILNVKWIALLKGKEKWLILLFLLVLVTINTALIGIYVYSDLGMNTKTGINKDMFFSNVFMGLIVAGVSAYHLVSFLTLLFYLPLSSVIEEQKSEIKSYQEIGEALQQQESTKETLDRLFKVCYKTTMSTSGWYVYIVDGVGEIEHTPDIKDVEIQLLSQRIGFDQLIQIEPKRGYYSFPDLERKRYIFNNEMPYRSLLVLPIFTQNTELKGVICLLKTFNYGFDVEMISLSKSYIDQAKLAFENSRLIKQTIEDARYKEEIEIATKVQEALMPTSFPNLEYCEIAAFSRSARDVGGDYYDYNMIDDYSMAVVIGDVSGKGAAAAFHMAQMKGIFQSLIQLCLPADNFLVMANHSISHCLEKNRFITLIYLAFDFGFRSFTYSRAGHCPILYYNAEEDTVKYLQDEGMGLGIIRNNSYTNFVEAHEVQLHVGDIIVLYTDGLVEGRSNAVENEQFGYERLKHCLRAYFHKSAEEIKEEIYRKFDSFTEGRDDTDDTAVVVIKITHL